jgi:hypothetical protein
VGQILDFNGIANALKQRYESKPVESLILKEHPSVADMPKDESKGGAAWNIAIKYAVMSTRATTVPTALANGSPDQYGKFTITNGLYNDYAVMQLSGVARDEARMGGPDSMVKLVDETLMGGYQAAYDSVANDIFGDGGGSRGQLSPSSTVNTATITLADPTQCLKFRVGMLVQSASDSGSYLLASPAGVRVGSVQLTGVDPVGGTLTASQTWNVAIPAIQASGTTTANTSDYLFAYGDYAARFPGLGSWIVPPGTTITSTPFFNQNRLVNTLLAGWNYAGGGANYEDTIAQLCAMVCQADGNPNRIYVNPMDFVQLGKQQSAKVRFERASVPSFTDPTLQFDGFSFVHPKGKADIVSDTFCPIGHFYALTMSSWTLYSNGKICRPDNDWAGDFWLKSYTDDVQQSRIITRAFIGSTAPWKNGHGTF